jgi:hypothetical protein
LGMEQMELPLAVGSRAASATDSTGRRGKIAG